MEILDARGKQVRRFSSTDLFETPDTNNFQYPTYWFRPEQKPGTSTGHHRFVWDLRYAPTKGSDRQYAIAAVYQNTPSGPNGPFVHPGKYILRLTVDGQVQEATLEVRLDPRVQASESDIQLQTDYSLACYEAYHRLQALRESVDDKLKGQLPAERRQAMQQLRGSGSPGGGDILYGSIYESSPDKETIVGLQEKFLHMLNLFQTADARPTAKAVEAVQKLQEAVANLEKRGKQI